MSSRSKNPEWDIAKFERERSHLCDWLKNTVITKGIEKGKRRIAIYAPVKSGKKQMVEFLALRNQKNTKHIHIFLTAWHRTADEDQRDELKHYVSEVLSGITCKKIEDYKAKIRKHAIMPDVTLTIHIDECDYGSAHNQLLGQIWKEWRAAPNITFILYSATPQELLFSGEIDDDQMMEELKNGVWFKYDPPEAFCGPEKFLRENLVSEARPFFEKAHEAGEHQLRLTDQARQIIAALCEHIKVDIEKRQRDKTWKIRNILMLRMCCETEDNEKTKSKKSKKAIHQFVENLHMFPELVEANCHFIIDKGDEKKAPSSMSHLCVAQTVQWSNPVFWNGITDSRPVIIINDQTCSRSTELAAHDRIFAYHDYRPTITFSVGSQAFERQNHYPEKYSGVFQPIRIYCHVNTMRLSAGQISYKEYLVIEWVARKQYKTEMYHIMKNDHTKEIHPDYPDPMTEADATKVLVELGCDKKEIKLSTRLRGKVDEEIKIHSEFVPCSSSDEFECLSREGRLNGKNGRGPRDNPFVTYPDSENPGRYQCLIRGVQKVRTVEEVKHEHWGINQSTTTRRHICYDGDVCGILIQSFDGYHDVNSLNAFKSMYASRK